MVYYLKKGKAKLIINKLSLPPFVPQYLFYNNKLLILLFRYPSPYICSSVHSKYDIVLISLHL